MLKSYLCKRMQYTLTGEKMSNLKLIELGVPQDSVLAPLLFFIFMKDLSVSQKQSNVILYADDTVLKNRSFASKIDEDHDNALDNVNDWLLKSKLTLSTKKSLLFVKNSAVSRTYLKIQKMTKNKVSNTWVSR